MKHGHRLPIVGLGLIALAVALVLLSPWEQDPVAANGIIHYVDADASGANNGSSWGDAFTELQPALDAALFGDQIWVAAGTYKPTSGTDRTISFQMENGVAIYGGFAGSETELEQRDWEANPTILSGDLNGDDGPDFANNDENSYHVFYHPDGTDLDGTAVLDGFTISGGNANGDSPNDSGGGMYNDGSSPTLTNCTFAGNSARYGGGMLNSVPAAPTLTNCTFANNSATFAGGGMNNYYVSPQLTNCSFSGNSANSGGGMYNTGNSSALTNCTFSDNWVDDDGGGVYNAGGSSTLTNCVFSGNWAGDDGGGMFNGYSSSPALANCTFADNSAGSEGGGIANYDHSSPTLTDCTLVGNLAGSGGGGMINFGNSAPELTDCIFEDNSASIAGGIYNSTSSPVLTDCTFDENSAGYYGGGMANSSSSPALTNCTFEGNSADGGGGGMASGSSSPALTNCTFADNSAGSEGGGIANYDHSSPTLINSILWGDTPDEVYSSDSTPVITYSDVQGGYPGETNINEDPLFVDPANRDYHLGTGSPCIDAGNNDVPYLPDYDFEGDPRILDGNNDGSFIVDMGVDEVVYSAPPVVIVEIDIRPGSDQNSINLGSGGVVPVAILTTAQFDAGTVRPASVRFAGARPRRWTLEDVDRDGDLDLLLNFRIRDLDLDETSTEATLTGETFPHAGGVPIVGTDTVRIVP